MQLLVLLLFLKVNSDALELERQLLNLFPSNVKPLSPLSPLDYFPHSKDSSQVAFNTSNIDIYRKRDAIINNLLVLDSPDSHFILAYSFLLSKFHLKINSNFSFIHFSILADRWFNSTAQAMVALMYSTGLGVIQDLKKALVYMSFAAISGETIALQTLGYWSLNGIIMERKCEDSVVYYEKAASKVVEIYSSGPPLGRSLPKHKTRLTEKRGGVYGYGASGPGNPSIVNKKPGALSQADIILHYEMLSDKGDISFQMLYATILYNGNAELPQNFKKAFELFSKVARKYPTGATASALKNKIEAAKLSDTVRSNANSAASAAGYIATMYLRGEGVAVDNATARQWFEKCAEWECAACYNALGVMNRDGSHGFIKNLLKAREYFVLGAAKSDSNAQANLDGMDYVNALKYFTVSQKQGNILASFRLAQMHAHGLGTSKYCHLATSYFKTLIEKADWHVSWIRDAEEYYETSTKNTPWVYLLLASELGYELAQENAAWILDREPKTSSINGLVILDKPNIPSVNDYVALNLWNRAANQGNVDARVKVGEYHFYGRGITKKMDNKPKFSFFSSTEYGTPDYEKAALYYQVAGDEHSSLALWNLGYLYENGLGVAKDFHLAKRMYDLSLTTNPGGYLPVNLALFYLNIRQFWSSLFNEAVVESLDNGLPRIEGQEDEFDEFEVYEGYALQVLVMILVLLFSYRFLMARIVPGVIVPAVVNAQVNVEGEAVAVPAAKEGVDLAAVHANVPVVEEVAQTVVADQPDNHDAEHEAERMHAVFG